MSRISSFSANTTLINQMLRTQLDVFDLQTQVSTQKRSQDYKGISLESQRLVNIENTRTQLQRYISNNSQQEVRLNITSEVLEGLRKTINNFKKDLSTYESGATKDEKRVEYVQTAAYQAMKSLEDLLNTDVDGRYLFAGGRLNTEPVDFQLSTLSSFQSTFDGAVNAVATTRSSSLERFSFSEDKNNKNRQFIDASNFLIFRQDYDGVTTNGGNSSITATSAMFSNVQAGSTITVTNSGSNNGTYTVENVTDSGRTIRIKTKMLTDEGPGSIGTITFRDPNDFNNTITKTGVDFGNLQFTRSTDTITASTTNAFSAIPAGWKFTIAGSTSNDGDYTVDTNDGTNIVIKDTKLTNEGFNAGNTFFDYHSGSQVVFTPNAGSNDDTIAIQQFGGGGAVPNAFKNLSAGDTVTFAGTGSNNATYTINAISSDGSTITVNETVALETDSNGATATGTNSFKYNAGTQMLFTAASNTIQIRDSAGGVINGGIVGNLAVGMTFTVSGTGTANDTTFTVSAIDNTTSTITVTGGVVDHTDLDGARIRSFAAAGTIAATPYYDGDELSLTHRTDDDHDFEANITAIHPAFEKAIRALKIIMQGDYGSEGGLDQHYERIGQAKYLLEASIEDTISGTPPFGTEQIGSLEALQQTVGFHESSINTQTALHKTFIGYLEKAVSNVENTDQLASVTRLLDQSRALEASYQAFSRIRQLSLSNFL